MIRTATLPLRGTRTTALVVPITFRGIDLTGAELSGVVLQRWDNDPASPEITLPQVVGATVTGLRFVAVETVDGIPESRITLTIAEGLMAGLPEAAEVGQDLNWVWYLNIKPAGGTKQRYVEGPFVIGGPQSGTGTFSSAIITYTEASVSVAIDGIDQVLPLVASASASAQQAQDWAIGDNPGGPGTKSAKTLAEEALLAAETAAAQSFAFPSITSGDLVILDSAGKRGPAWLNSNSPEFLELQSAMAAVVASAPATFPFPCVAPGIVFVDSTGRLGPVFLTGSSDELQAQLAGIEDEIALLKGAAADAVAPIGDVLQVVNYGQSMSPGTGSFATLTNAPVPGGLRFSVGVRPTDSGSENPADWGAAFAPLKETVSPIINSQGETSNSGMVQRINERLTADYGCTLVELNQKMHVSSVGQGGASVVDLSAGTVPHTRMLNAFQKARDIAAGAGQAINPLALTWFQGESDQNNNAVTYYNAVKAIVAAARAKGDAMRGYARPMLFVSYQPTSWATAINNAPLTADSFLWFQERDPYGLYSAPTYHLPHSDEYHLTAAGYKQLGAHFGDVIYDFLWKGYRKGTMRPAVTRLSARELVLTYDIRPGARLVIDSSAAVAANEAVTQLGIRIVPAGNTAYVDPATDARPTQEIAAEVRLSGRNTIYVKAAADIPTGGAYEVRQGWYDCLYRNCTHIRDNAGDVLPTFDPGGVNVKLHNWAPVCREVIP